MWFQPTCPLCGGAVEPRNWRCVCLPGALKKAMRESRESLERELRKEVVANVQKIS
jgi:hypothetical protein